MKQKITQMNNSNNKSASIPLMKTSIKNDTYVQMEEFSKQQEQQGSTVTNSNDMTSNGTSSKIPTQNMSDNQSNNNNNNDNNNNSNNNSNIDDNENINDDTFDDENCSKDEDNNNNESSSLWIEIKSLIVELMNHNKEKNWKKKVLTVTIIVSSMFVFYDLLFVGNFQRIMEQFVTVWMANHPSIAVVAFIFFFVLSTLIFIPPPILILAAGYAFAQAIGIIPGIIAAFLASFIGSCLGAIIAFYRSRYMMRDTIQLFAKRYPIVRAADRALKQNGFYIMLLLRLCPIIPFNGLNYIGGITSVKWDEFTAALIGIIPIQLLLLIVGATAESFFAATHGGNTTNRCHDDNDFDANDVKNQNHLELGFIICICAGIGFGIVGIAATWVLAKEELQKQLHLEQEEMETYLPSALAKTSRTSKYILSALEHHDHEAGIATRSSLFGFTLPSQQQQEQQQQRHSHGSTPTTNTTPMMTNSTTATPSGQQVIQNSIATNTTNNNTIDDTTNPTRATVAAHATDTEANIVYKHMEEGNNNNDYTNIEIQQGEDEEWFWIWA